MASGYSGAQDAQKKAAQKKVASSKTPGAAKPKTNMLGVESQGGLLSSSATSGGVPTSGTMTMGTLKPGHTPAQTPQDRLKSSAKGALADIISAGKSGIKGLDRAQSEARQALSGAAQTARQQSLATAGGALAAGQASAGRFGGSAYGGALQAGLGAAQQGADIAQKMGMQQAQVGMQGAKTMDKARRLAAEDKFQAFKAEAELGTTKENQARKWADYEQRIATAGSEAGMIGEQDEVARQVRKWATMEDDPEMKQKLLNEANAIASGQRDV